MKESDKLWWEQTRAKGRLSFLVREGVLRHGFRVGIWLTFIGVVGWISGGIQLQILWVLGGLLIASSFFGSLIGLVLWNQYEKNYRKM